MFKKVDVASLLITTVLIGTIMAAVMMVVLQVVQP